MIEIERYKMHELGEFVSLLSMYSVVDTLLSLLVIPYRPEEKSQDSTIRPRKKINAMKK